jgi:tetratricopeptide (TPR) repeat protein
MLANMGALRSKEGNQKAKALVAKALELDPDSAPAHSGKGWGLLVYHLDFAGAGAEFKRAVELNANSAEAHQGVGEYYATQGQMQSAVRELQYARELDPLGLIVNNSLCQVLVFARRYDEALVQCKANLDLGSDSVRPLWLLGELYAAKGMESEAVSSFLEALRRVGASSTMMAAVEAGGRKGGTRGYWQALIQFIPENLSTGNIGPFEAAATYLYAGDADKAMPWLEKAVEARSFGVSFLVADPAFDSLRSDPRFIAALLKKMGLPQGKLENS